MPCNLWPKPLIENIFAIFTTSLPRSIEIFLLPSKRRMHGNLGACPIFCIGADFYEWITFPPHGRGGFPLSPCYGYRFAPWPRLGWLFHVSHMFELPRILAYSIWACKGFGRVSGSLLKMLFVFSKEKILHNAVCMSQKCLFQLDCSGFQRYNGFVPGMEAVSRPIGFLFLPLILSRLRI